jgi:NAD(P)-dependent dehydrogenase (short-subunit alcohol dehydrogenase family)
VDGLAGRTALVTGAARGIGAAICARLIGEGVRVIGLDRAMVPAQPGITPVNGDIREIADVRRALRVARQAGGPVDLLVNNAGLIERGDFRLQELGHWQDVIQTNLTGSFVVTREAAAELAGQPGAAIVTVTSVAARIGGTGMAAYAASKAALQALNRVVALELAGTGVRANAVAPGIIATDMTTGTAAPPSAEVVSAVARIPLGRLGHPDDVAAAVAFLLSADASYITGTTLVVDGGYSVA